MYRVHVDDICAACQDLFSAIGVGGGVCSQPLGSINQRRVHYINIPHGHAERVLNMRYIEESTLPTLLYSSLHAYRHVCMGCTKIETPGHKGTSHRWRKYALGQSS